jgi:hypothetical protein
VKLETAKATVSRIASLASTIRSKPAALSSMSLSDQAIWSRFVRGMVSQYKVDKCAQIYSSPLAAWHTCCPYDRVEGTSFSFCTATASLGIATPGMRQIDIGDATTITAKVPAVSRQADTDARNVLSAEDTAGHVQHQATNPVPVFSIDLSPRTGPPKGSTCNSGNLQAACYSFCCLAQYATVSLQSHVQSSTADLTVPSEQCTLTVFGVSELLFLL